MRTTILAAPVVALHLLFLLSVTFGNAALAAPMADLDRDGVADDRDYCAGTPAGVAVGLNGCPTFGDEDGDGVLDVVDVCPLSPPDAWVDAQGCALDSDIDGVADGLDRCPGSLLGSFVDVQGCATGQTAQRIAPQQAGRRQVSSAIPVAPAGPRASGSQRPVMPTFPEVPTPSGLRVNPDMRVSAVPDPLPATPRPLPAPPKPAVRKPAALDPTLAPELTADASRDVADTAPTLADEVASQDRVELIAFDAGKTRLSRRASRQVKALADGWRAQLDSDALLQLSLSGHGDIKTDGLEAPRIALQRAQAVRGRLVEAGIPAHRIQMRAAGVAEPRFGGPEMSRNSRVELRLVQGPVQVAAATSASVSDMPAAAPTPPSSASIRFAPYSSLIEPDAVATINRYVESLLDELKAPASRLRVRGFIDAQESGAPAKRLAQSRAAGVRAYLVSLGIPAQRIDATAATDASGRRAELSLLRP